MARIRTIKPTLWDSEKLGRLSTLARLNFVGLISFADDEGRGRGELRWLLGHIHPYAADRVTEQEFTSAILELEAAHLVVFYKVNGFRYYALPGWQDHQYIEKPKKSELPSVPKDNPAFPLLVPDQSPTRPRSIPVGMEGNGRDRNGKDLTTAAPAAVDQSILERRLPAWSKEYPKAIIANVPADYCSWALDNVRGLSKATKEALALRVKVKKDEANGMSKVAKL